MPNVDELLAGAREAIHVRRVFGEAYQEDGVTVIPAAVVRGGGGGGGDTEGNGGGGFGVQARPVGVYVVKDGEVEWKPAVDPNRIVTGWQAVSVLALMVAWAFARTLRSR
jgi:uncharacterized spore protein YtfJ